MWAHIPQLKHEYTNLPPGENILWIKCSQCLRHKYRDLDFMHQSISCPSEEHGNPCGQGCLHPQDSDITLLNNINPREIWHLVSESPVSAHPSPGNHINWCICLISLLELLKWNKLEYTQVLFFLFPICKQRRYRHVTIKQWMNIRLMWSIKPPDYKIVVILIY